MPRHIAIQLTRHWIVPVQALLLLFAMLPVLAPLLLGGALEGAAETIIRAYSFVCHQLPSRSYVLAGHAMAYCQRDTAIYSTMAVSGLLWPRIRRRLPPLSWSGYLLLCAPMALDGFTQLAGLRESTWELRTITGALFGVACVWFGFPLAETTAKLIRIALRAGGRRHGPRDAAPAVRGAV